MKSLLGIISMVAASAALLLGVPGCGGSQTPSTDSAASTTTPDTATTKTTDQPVDDLGMAPDATLLAEDGTKVQLASAWNAAPAVIIFLRGPWCPYCIQQLEELQKNIEKFRALKTNLIAISNDPKDPEKIRAQVGTEFVIYSDPDLAAIKAFEVLHEGENFARPAAFIVSTDGKIRFRYVGENAKDTVLLKILFAELEKLEPQAS